MGAPFVCEDAAWMVRSVLVVDDDASFRHLASRVLMSWGHNVVGQAGTVAEAMARTSELQPDTVLADIGLPDGDGFALTRDLLLLPSPPRVVLISSDSDSVNGPAAERVGAAGFVPKDELPGALLRQLIESD
jgi:CheY-like chemotaxis protein